MIRIDPRLAALAAACSMLSGCGGGGAGGSSQTDVPPSKPQAFGTNFVIHIPAKAKNPSSKRPAYITANVTGIDFTVTAATSTNPIGYGYVFYPLLPQSTYCVSSGSGLLCTLAVNAPPGGDTFKVNLYDTPGAPALGYVVATATVSATISANAINTVNVTTNGVPTFAVVGAVNASPATGSATTIPLQAQIVDPDGNIIVGSFDTPLTVTNSDTSGSTVVTPTVLNQTSDENALQVTYNGSGMPTASIAITSSSPALGVNGALASTSITPGATGPSVSPSALYFAHVSSASQNIAVAGQNGSVGPFSVGIGSCNGFITVTGSSPNFTVAPVASTFNAATPFLSSGTCTFQVTDASSNQYQESVIVSP